METNPKTKLLLEDIEGCYIGAGGAGLTETEAQSWMSDCIPRNRFISQGEILELIKLLRAEGKLLVRGDQRKGHDVYVHKNFKPQQSGLDFG